MTTRHNYANTERRDSKTVENYGGSMRAPPFEDVPSSELPELSDHGEGYDLETVADALEGGLL